MVHVKCMSLWACDLPHKLRSPPSPRCIKSAQYTAADVELWIVSVCGRNEMIVDIQRSAIDVGEFLETKNRRRDAQNIMMEARSF